MNCPICGNSENTTFMAKYVKAACCGNSECRHIWAVDVLPNAGVQTKTNIAAEKERFRLRNQDLARFLIKRGILKPNAKLLDLGSGVGHILTALRDSVGTLDIVAVEPDSNALLRLRELEFRAYSSIEDVPDHDFDAVIMIEVIEHASDPIRLLDQVNRRMADGGMVFFTTPVGAMRNGSRKTNAYDTPEHVQFITERSLSLAFVKAGFVRFRLETINEMTGALTPGIEGMLKNLLRPVRSRILGHCHLTGFALKVGG